MINITQLLYFSSIEFKFVKIFRIFSSSSEIIDLFFRFPNQSPPPNLPWFQGLSQIRAPIPTPIPMPTRNEVRPMQTGFEINEFCPPLPGCREGRSTPKEEPIAMRHKNRTFWMKNNSNRKQIFRYFEKKDQHSPCLKAFWLPWQAKI